MDASHVRWQKERVKRPVTVASQPSLEELSVTVLRRSPPFTVSLARLTGPTLHLVMRGSATLSRSGFEVLAHAGDLVFFPAATASSESGPSAVVVHCESRALGDSVELVSASIRGCTGVEQHPALRIRHRELLQVPELASVLKLLASELRVERSNPRHALAPLTQVLFAYLLRARADVRALAAPRAPDSRIQRALELMHTRPEHRWTVQSLAKAAGLSRTAFARRFTAALGASPLRYLTELRLRRAAELLTTSDGSLAEIAAEVGYDSEFAFSRAFKRYTGKAPGLFRRGGGVGGGTPIMARAA